MTWLSIRALTDSTMDSMDSMYLKSTLTWEEKVVVGRGKRIGVEKIGHGFDQSTLNTHIKFINNKKNKLYCFKINFY